METLKSYLKGSEHMLEKEIRLEKKGLKLAPALEVAHDFSKRHHRDNAMNELKRTEQEIHKGVEHLEHYGDIKETKSLTTILADYFYENNYANRIVDIRQRISPGYVIQTLEKHKVSKAYAQYGLWTFDMKDTESWKRHRIELDHMIVMYAAPPEGGEALQEIGSEIGVIVGEKKDAYGKFFHRDYTVQSKMHARPATEFVTLVKSQNGRVLVRDSKKQVRGDSIMGVLTFGAAKGKKLTVLYRPSHDIQDHNQRIIAATAFYHAIEKLGENGTPLLKRIGKK